MKMNFFFSHNKLTKTYTDRQTDTQECTKKKKRRNEKQREENLKEKIERDGWKYILIEES